MTKHLHQISIYRNRVVDWMGTKAGHAQSWIAGNWFRLLLIGLGCLILLKKDLTLQLSLKNGMPLSYRSLGHTPGNAGSEAAPLKKPVSFSDKEEAVPVETQKNYIDRFVRVAQLEMKKYGIPASIKLGQALLETKAGTSPLATVNNNHFGIKCFSSSCRPGHCSNFSDDSHKDFFRKYNSAWESWRHHSQLLQKDRYAHLFKLKSDDYRAWAKGLQQAGYATDKKYAKKLIGIIERMELYRYDSV